MPQNENYESNGKRVSICADFYMIFDIENGYKQAIAVAKQHYENFPVISFLLPKHARKHIAIFYWFARTADDFADESNYTSDQRMAKLNELEFRLNDLLKGNFNSDFEYALHNTIINKKLSSDHFYNLLKAFKQDTVKQRYENFDELLAYCKNSANPVGRIVLEIFDIKNDKLFFLSDKICTALQITNFLQDILIDYDKGRIYLPKDEMERFEVTEKMFELKENNINLRQLAKFYIQRTYAIFGEGKTLIKHLKGGLKLEIDWTVRGGELILQKIKENNYNLFSERPVITKPDVLKILLKSIIRQ